MCFSSWVWRSFNFTSQVVFVILFQREWKSMVTDWHFFPVSDFFRHQTFIFSSYWLNCFIDWSFDSTASISSKGSSLFVYFFLKWHCFSFFILQDYFSSNFISCSSLCQDDSSKVYSGRPVLSTASFNWSSIYSFRQGSHLPDFGCQVNPDRHDIYWKTFCILWLFPAPNVSILCVFLLFLHMLLVCSFGHLFKQRNSLQLFIFSRQEHVLEEGHCQWLIFRSWGCKGSRILSFLPSWQTNPYSSWSPKGDFYWCPELGQFSSFFLFPTSSSPTATTTVTVSLPAPSSQLTTCLLHRIWVCCRNWRSQRTSPCSSQTG